MSVDQPAVGSMSVLFTLGTNAVCRTHLYFVDASYSRKCSDSLITLTNAVFRQNIYRKYLSSLLHVLSADGSSEQEDGDTGVKRADRGVAFPGGSVDSVVEREENVVCRSAPLHGCRGLTLAAHDLTCQGWLPSCGDINLGATTVLSKDGAALSLHSVSRRALSHAGGSIGIVHIPPGGMSGRLCSPASLLEFLVVSAQVSGSMAHRF